MCCLLQAMGCIGLLPYVLLVASNGLYRSVACCAACCKQWAVQVCCLLCCLLQAVGCIGLLPAVLLVASNGLYMSVACCAACCKQGAVQACCLLCCLLQAKGYIVMLPAVLQAVSYVSMTWAKKSSRLVRQLRLFLKPCWESPIRLFISKCVISLPLTNIGMLPAVLLAASQGLYRHIACCVAYCKLGAEQVCCLLCCLLQATG